MPSCGIITRTPTDLSANVNNAGNMRIFITYRRAAPQFAHSSLAVIDIAVIIASKVSFLFSDNFSDYKVLFFIVWILERLPCNFVHEGTFSSCVYDLIFRSLVYSQLSEQVSFTCVRPKEAVFSERGMIAFATCHIIVIIVGNRNSYFKMRPARISLKLSQTVVQNQHPPDSLTTGLQMQVTASVVWC